MSTFEGSWTRRARARVGRVLKDKWKLERLLGVGGTAAVYQARHRNGQLVAVKMLHADLADDHDMRARFVREGYIANRVGHPSALAVLDDDVDDDGSSFLVMELLDGETVEARWKRYGRKLPPEEVLVIAAQVLDVLEAAHGKSIIHRDIKPENLFLTREGKLKVLDFGIARLRDSVSRIRVTQTGVAVGTPAYMPPEQARGRNELVDGQTDVWSVGATMFTLMTGRLVHEAATGNEQLLAAMLRPAPSLMSVMPHAPGPVIDVVDHALAFEKKDRFASAAVMRDAVREAYLRLVGVPMPSIARLAVPSAAPEVDAHTGTGWVKTEMNGALVPFGRRAVSAVRAHWRPATMIGVGFLAVLVSWRMMLAPSFVSTGRTVPVAAAPPAPPPPIAQAPPQAVEAPPSAIPSAQPAPPPTAQETRAQKPNRPQPTPQRVHIATDDDPGPIRK